MNIEYSFFTRLYDRNADYRWIIGSQNRPYLDYYEKGIIAKIHNPVNPSHPVEAFVSINEFSCVFMRTISDRKDAGGREIEEWSFLTIIEQYTDLRYMHIEKLFDILRGMNKLTRSRIENIKDASKASLVEIDETEFTEFNYNPYRKWEPECTASELMNERMVVKLAEEFELRDALLPIRDIPIFDTNRRKVNIGTNIPESFVFNSEYSWLIYGCKNDNNALVSYYYINDHSLNHGINSRGKSNESKSLKLEDKQSAIEKISTVANGLIQQILPLSKNRICQELSESARALEKIIKAQESKIIANSSAIFFARLANLANEIAILSRSRTKVEDINDWLERAARISSEVGVKNQQASYMKPIMGYLSDLTSRLNQLKRRL